MIQSREEKEDSPSWLNMTHILREVQRFNPRRISCLHSGIELHSREEVHKMSHFVKRRLGCSLLIPFYPRDVAQSIGWRNILFLNKDKEQRERGLRSQEG